MSAAPSDEDAWRTKVLNTFISVVEAWEEQQREPLQPDGPALLSPEFAARSAMFERAATAESTSAELALSAVIPDWAARITTGWFVPKRFVQMKALAQEAVALIERRLEHDAHTAPAPSPAVDSTQLHHLVWEAARPTWVGGHYRHAVADAVEAVNALVKSRTGYTTTGANLYEAAFSPSPAKANHPRLRLAADDNSENFRNVQLGASHLGQACVAGLRNPTSHGVTTPLNPQAPLEQLAMISVLARWVDAADVHHWEPPTNSAKSGGQDSQDPSSSAAKA